jgi:hypothetical protein
MNTVLGCSNYPRNPKVFQCEKGHLICSKCMMNDKKICPTMFCNSKNITSNPFARNLANLVLVNVIVNCIYQKNGCPEKGAIEGRHSKSKYKIFHLYQNNLGNCNF